MADSSSNSVASLSTAGMAGVLVWGLKCWKGGQIEPPDDSVAIVLAGFFIPLGYLFKGVASTIFQRIFGKSIQQLEQEGRT